MKAEVALNKPIKENSCVIPRKFEDQNSEKEKKLVYSNDNMNKLRSVAKVRKQGMLHFFQTELFGVYQRYYYVVLLSIIKSGTLLIENKLNSNLHSRNHIFN